MTSPQAAVPTCYRHPDRETYVSCVRCGRPICSECMRPASVGFQCPDEVSQARRTTRAPQGRFGGQLAAHAYATYALIAINMVMFVITTASGTSFVDGSKQSALFDRLALVPDGRPGGQPVSFGVLGRLEPGVAHGQYERLVSSMFLHFGIIHILLNMYVLFAIGPQLESVLGRIRYVGIYLLAGFGGAVSSYLFGPLTEVGAGASGAIFGLFGAYFVVARRIQAQTGPIVTTIVINLVLSVSISNIDIRAHLGGLVVGALVGFVLAYAPRQNRLVVQSAGCAAVLLALLLAAALRTSALRSDDRRGPLSGPLTGVTPPVAAPARPGLPPPV